MQEPARMQILCKLQEHRGPINETMVLCQIDTLEICFSTCGAAYNRQQHIALFGAHSIALHESFSDKYHG